MTDEELHYIQNNLRWPTPIADSIHRNKYYYLLGASLIFVIYEYNMFADIPHLVGHIAIFLFIILMFALNIQEYKEEHKFDSILIPNIQMDVILKTLNELNWELDSHTETFVHATLKWNFLSSSKKITVVLLKDKILVNSITSSAKERNKYNRAKIFDQFKKALEKEVKF